jgi:hypothetical protein
MLRCESGRSAHTSIPRGNRLRDERGGLGYVRGGPATRFTSGPLPGRVPVVDTQQPVVVTDGLHTPVTPSPSQPPARLGPGPCRSARSLLAAADGAGTARRGVDQPTGGGHRPLSGSLRHANTRPGRKGADDDGLLGPIARCLTPADRLRSSLRCHTPCLGLSAQAALGRGSWTTTNREMPDQVSRR